MQLTAQVARSLTGCLWPNSAWSAFPPRGFPVEAGRWGKHNLCLRYGKNSEHKEFLYLVHVCKCVCVGGGEGAYTYRHTYLGSTYLITAQTRMLRMPVLQTLAIDMWGLGDIWIDVTDWLPFGGVNRREPQTASQLATVTLQIGLQPISNVDSNA